MGCWTEQLESSCGLLSILDLLEVSEVRILGWLPLDARKHWNYYFGPWIASSYLKLWASGASLWDHVCHICFMGALATAMPPLLKSVQNRLSSNYRLVDVDFSFAARLFDVSLWCLKGNIVLSLYRFYFLCTGLPHGIGIYTLNLVCFEQLEMVLLVMIFSFSFLFFVLFFWKS